jgi:hypothetical protein
MRECEEGCKLLMLRLLLEKRSFIRMLLTTYISFDSHMLAEPLQRNHLPARLLACVIFNPEYDSSAILQHMDLAAAISSEFARKEQDVA